MRKLLKLRKWLTVPEAARHLSIQLGDDISESDVLRLALDGHLTLSVSLLSAIQARRGRVVELANAPIKSMPSPTSALAPNEQIVMGWSVSPSHVFVADDNTPHGLETIDGVWNLPMLGAERSEVEARYQRMTGGPQMTAPVHEGTVICDSKGTQFLIVSSSFTEPHDLEGSASISRNHSNHTSPFPKEATFVVVIEALRAFEDSIADHDTSDGRHDDHLAGKERSSALKLIIGMAVKGYRYDPLLQRSGISTEIANDLEAVGVPLDADTIRKWLKESAQLLPGTVRKN